MSSSDRVRRRAQPLGVALVCLLALAGCGTQTMSTPQTAPPAGPTAAMCGPGSQPAASGGETRYIPCDYDLRHARVFLDAALPLLPTASVDTAAIDQVAADDTYLSDFASTYQGSQLEPDGSVIASWIPTPDACAVFTWNGQRWDSEIVGELVTGGCVSDANG